MLRNLNGRLLRYASSETSSFTEVNSGVASVAGLEYDSFKSRRRCVQMPFYENNKI